MSPLKSFDNMGSPCVQQRFNQKNQLKAPIDAVFGCFFDF